MSASVSSTLPAIANGALQILETNPFDTKVYYTCNRTMSPDSSESKMIRLGGTTWEFIGTHPQWNCVKGRGMGRVVDLCAYQPSSWHRKSLAKKLHSPEEFVTISSSSG